MQGADQFCERCGTLQPKPDAAAPRSAGRLARRMLDAAGIIETRQEHGEDWLRLCLNCRGYSCPNCWNETAGVCQTCEPMPEPVVVVEALPEPAMIEAAVIEPVPYWVTQLEPLVAPRPEQEPEFEPVALAEPEAEPEPVVVAAPEPEPEPVVVAAPEPEPEPEPVAAEREPEPLVEPLPERPAMPRMPVLPLPPPRPADAPVMPLPLPAYPIPPQIAFNVETSVGASTATAAPAFEAHMLLAPPAPELSASALAAGLRPCGNCHLTLSARAHFCRRCGTQQPH
jgi:hypothetical protein